MSETSHGRGETPGPKPRRPAGGRRAPQSAVRLEHSAGLVLFRLRGATRLYLLLDYGKHWDYAKGHLEKGETPWQAAVREVREETGIAQVRRVGAFQRDMQYEFYSQRKGRIRKRVTFFLAETHEEAVQLSEEHVGYAWLPLPEALARLTYENARSILLEAAASAPEAPDPAVNAAADLGEPAAPPANAQGMRN